MTANETRKKLTAIRVIETGTYRVTREAYEIFLLDYYNEKYKGLRLGQAFFCFIKEELGVTPPTDPKLFYEREESVADAMILAKYIYR